MAEAIQNAFVQAFGEHTWLAVFLISMIPIVELRGAIPFGMSVAIWGSGALTWWQAYLCAVIGSTIPAMIIVPLLIPVFTWMKKTKWFKGIATSLEEKFKSKSDKVSATIQTEATIRRATLRKFWGTATFIAIPFPLTGAWTGSAIAAYLNLGWVKGVSAAFVGNAIAGAIMVLVCSLFVGYEDIILYAFCGLAVLVILTAIVVKFILKKKKAKKEASAPQLMEITDFTVQKETETKTEGK